MEKRCAECLIYKSIDYFTKQKQGKFGVRSKCKACLRIEDYKYIKSKDGVVTQIFTVQKRSAKKRGMEAPSYSKIELKEWLFSREIFHILYETWARGGYKRKDAVSIDRIDDYISYRFDNIQILTWGENRDKRHKDVLSGINNKQSRAVVKMSLDGNYICEYYSIHQAMRETGINVATIHNTCSGKQITSGGYKWRFKDDK